VGDLLRAGVLWQLKKLEEGVSMSMIYRRGALSVGVQVTVGRSEYDAFDDEGNLVTQVTDATFIMAADKLTLGGSVVEPESGDRLEEVTSRGTRHYEVMSSGGGVQSGSHRRPFSRDASNQFLRIHTKFIKAT